MNAPNNTLSLSPTRVCVGTRHVSRPSCRSLAGSPVGSLGGTEARGGGDARQGSLLRQQDIDAVLTDKGSLGELYAGICSSVVSSTKIKISNPYLYECFFFCRCYECDVIFRKFSCFSSVNFIIHKHKKKLDQGLKNNV